MNVFHYTTTLVTDDSETVRTLHFFALATDPVIMIEYDAHGCLTVVPEKVRLEITKSIVPETLALDRLDAETLLSDFIGAHNAAKQVAEGIALSKMENVSALKTAMERGVEFKKQAAIAALKSRFA